MQIIYGGHLYFIMIKIAETEKNVYVLENRKEYIPILKHN